MGKDKVIKRITKIEEDVKEIKETMVTKTDFEKVVQSQDKMMVFLKRMDSERIFTNEAIKKLRKNDERQDSEIKAIRINVKMA